MPLANGVDAGLEDARARRARDEFRDTFAAGYVDAFPTFAATTKRPRMVLDAYEIAARVARLHGARTVRVLLVDAMRWDLSRDIQARLVARLGGRASLTDEMLLWSALPATTMRQLETIARGMEALRSPAPTEGEPPAPRTRNAEHVRRMRVGPREIYKLDLVESCLAAARGGVIRALPEIADAVADAVARHIETLTPRTLLFVMGDHGFRVDKGGAAREGARRRRRSSSAPMRCSSARCTDRGRQDAPRARKSGLHMPDVLVAARRPLARAPGRSAPRGPRRAWRDGVGGRRLGGGSRGWSVARCAIVARG